MLGLAISVFQRLITSHYTYFPKPSGNNILDESAAAIQDESGQNILDEG